MIKKRNDDSKYNSQELNLDFVERDKDAKQSDTDSFNTDSDEEMQNISANILNNSFLNCVNDLELCFIFISTDVHGTIEELDEDEDVPIIDRKKKEKMKYGEKIYWTRVNLSIIQIVKNGMEDQLKYIMTKAQD